MKNVIIVGMGQLGRRHAQSLAGFGSELEITLVDSNPSSLETAKDFLEPLFKDNISVKSIYLNNLEQVSSYSYDLAIIATTSSARLSVLEALLSRCKVKFCILEKFLFSDISEYDKAYSMLCDANVVTFVNCPFRAMESYKQLKRQISPCNFLKMTVKGKGWGLFCNMIHYVDLFSYFIGDNRFNIASSFNNDKLSESKRVGYNEAYGEIAINNGKGRLTLVCDEGDFTGAQVEIETTNATYLIDENKQMLYYSTKEDPQIVESNFYILYQSQLTKELVEDIFENQTCSLSLYEDSANLHIQLLKNLNKAFEKQQLKIT